MQEGQNAIFTLKSALYMQGAPVLIEKGTLSLEGERAYIRLRYKNLEEKPIVFLQVRLFVLDAYGMEVKSLKRNYIHLHAEPNASFGEENAIEIASPKARRFFAHVSEVRFSDESVWTSEDSAWTIAPTQEDEDLPFRYKDLYYCRCGYIGKFELCPCCQSYLGNSVELEELSDSLDTRSLDGTQSGDAEFSKNDAKTLVDEYQTKDLQEEKTRFEDIKLVYGYSKKEKIKRALIATAVSVCIVGGLGLWIGSGIAKSIKYKEAISLLDEGKYAEAVQSFTELGDYRQSEEYLEKANNYHIGNFKASLDENTKEFVVPYGITEIIPSAFENCWWLQRVVLPDTIEKIGDKAFYGCTSLQEVQVDGCVLEIGNEAFYNCSSLESFPFPVSVSSIGERAFYCCSALESIDFSYGGVDYWESPFGGIYRIGADAFRGCNSVTEVTLPSSLNYIGKNAFSACENLESFTLEQAQGNFSVASEGLFEYTNLKTATVVAELVPAIRLVQGVQSLEVTSGDIPDKGDIDHWNDHTEDWQTLVLREGVTSIGERAFENASITEVVFPSTLRKIGKSAFTYTSLQEVTFNGIVDIGDGCFSKEIPLVYARNIDDWQRMSFASSNANPLCYGGKLYFTENCDLRFTVEEVSPYAFYGCSGIYADGELTELVFADTVKRIGKYAFYNCSFLTSVVAGELNEVGDEAFSGCSGLKSVSITDVQTLGDYVFYGVNALEEATASTTVMLPLVNTSKSTLKTARFTRGEKVESYMFYNCKKLTTVSLLEGLTGISDCAFYGCESLTAITLPNTVVNFGGNVFAGCTALTTIYYKGAQSEWENISGYLYFENPELTVYYYSEEQPTDSGNYWHYESGYPMIWVQELSFEKIDGKEEYRVTGIGSMTTTVRIPSTYEGLPVTEIGEDAFNSCNDLWQVFISDGVTKIGGSAFANCSALKNITIPESVHTIGSSVFASCENLINVYYKGSKEAWSDVEIQTSGNEVLSRAVCFYKEDEPSFSHEDPISDGECYWHYDENGAFAFWDIGTQGLSFTKINDNAYCVDGGWDGGNIVIPSRYEGLPVTEIRECAFQDGHLTSVVIPNSVTRIGNFAFSNCSFLKKVTLGNASEAGEYAFANCYQLTSVVIGSGVTFIGNAMFINCPSLTNVYYKGTVSDWANIRIEGGNDDLRRATCYFYSEDEESNGNYWHYDEKEKIFVWGSGTEGLDYEVMQESYRVTGIGTATETDIVIVSTYNGLPVTEIGGYAFENRSDLTSITIPDGVTSIGDYAFYGCDNLTSVYYKGMASNWASITIGDANDSLHSATIYYYSETEPTDSGNYWHYESGEIVVWDKVDEPTDEPTVGTEGLTYEKIEGQEAYRVTGIGTATETDIVIPSTYEGLPVTEIGESAFESSTITSIVIPRSVTNIGIKAFYTCRSLAKAEIPNSVVTIGNHAFCGCTALTSMTLPDGIESIEAVTFGWCANLSSVTIPDSVTNIGNNAFVDCYNLASITIPDGVTSIGNSAFANCNNLTSVYYKGTASEWESIIVEETGNELLISATIYYYSETEPTDGGNYWHYENGEIVVWDKVDEPTDEPIEEPTVGTEGLTYEKIEGQEAYRVTGIGTATETDIVIASTYEGLPVTEIGQSAFEACNEITSVVIPSSVTNIGIKAFYTCTNLAKAEISNSVTTIGNNAFCGCHALTSVTIPDGIESIESATFGWCLGLTSVTIPDSVKSVGTNAFVGCNNLTSITISNSVMSIADMTFYDCRNLTSVYYKGTASEWASITIGGANDSLNSATIYYYSETEPTESGNYWRYENGEIVVWDKVDEPTVGTEGLTYEKIEGQEAYRVTGIGTATETDIVIPSTYEGLPVTSIGDSAFANCSNLTNITIPDSVTSIGNWAFMGCGSLISITIPDGVTSIGEDIFRDCSGLTSIAIPDSITSIGFGAFYGCSSLTSITIPDGVTNIGDSAFEACSKLRDITIPDGVTSIGNSVFRGCGSLTEITIPNSVMNIGDSAFRGCGSLTEITIPENVISIGESVFSDCNGLTSIMVSGNNTTYQSIDGNLYSKDGKTLIQYAIGKTEISFTVPGEVTRIDDYAFYGCNSLTSITIPNSVTSIGYYAFMCCDSLTSIMLPDSVISIGSFVFYDCSSLMSVIIPDSVTSVYGAFADCSNLTSIMIGSGVTKIDDYTFYNCYNLTSVYYKGTESDWASVAIGEDNAPLYSATVYYYSETEPTDSGNYWRYENGEIVLWKEEEV